MREATNKILGYIGTLCFLVMPYTISESVAYPSIEVTEFVVNICHTEVIYPSSLNLVKFLNTFIKTHWSGFTRDSFELLLKLLPTLV